MACGQFAEPIYNLLDELGGPEESSNLVLRELIKFLPGERIREFVDDFRLNHDMEDSIIQTHFDPSVDDPTEDMLEEGSDSGLE
tara:strand:+ start:90 stop:341 length:252 start_codon:yes stop_codon:yes gene_type:complete